MSSLRDQIAETLRRWRGKQIMCEHTHLIEYGSAADEVMKDIEPFVANRKRAEQAEAEREQLRATALDLVTSVQNERDELLADLERVRAVHRPQTAKRVQPCDTHEPQLTCSRCEVIDVTVCSHSGCHGWPCKTIAALDPPDGGQ